MTLNRFHKIPHLQQGVMKSDSDAERSQFAHPDFHRDQEDRLIFIERKKQVASNGKEQGIVDFPSLPTQPATQAPTDPSTGQALDIHAIVNGISAIRRHQANISTELSELKRSNQLLWQESMDARSRHQKQQDTINKIIKFLGSLFTTHATPAGKEKERGPASHSVVRGSRLMIEDKKRDVVPKVGIVEVQDEDAVSLISRDGSPRTLFYRLIFDFASHPDISRPLCFNRNSRLYHFSFLTPFPRRNNNPLPYTLFRFDVAFF